MEAATAKRVPWGWIAGALVAVAAVALVAFLGGGALEPTAPAATEEIHVTASQYRFDPGEIQVAKGTRVVLHLTSADVTHGLEIPAFRVNANIPPGETVTVSFVADRAGEFEMFCNVFCGTGHPQHRGTLKVV